MKKLKIALIIAFVVAIVGGGIYELKVHETRSQIQGDHSIEIQWRTYQWHQDNKWRSFILRVTQKRYVASYVLGDDWDNVTDSWANTDMSKLTTLGCDTLVVKNPSKSRFVLYATRAHTRLIAYRCILAAEGLVES